MGLFSIGNKKKEKKEFTVKNEMAREFFEARFKRKPEQDQDYYMEWEDRFRSGHPETWMDSESLAVYKKQLKRKSRRL